MRRGAVRAFYRGLACGTAGAAKAVRYVPGGRSAKEQEPQPGQPSAEELINQRDNDESDFRVARAGSGAGSGANSGIRILEYTGTRTVVRVPARIQNLPVIAISDEAFRMKDVTVVTLPPFGDIRARYLAGGPGTYTRPNAESQTWAKQ